MNDIVKKALNRGAPIDTPIIIDIYEMVQIFDSEAILDDYKVATADIISKISNIIDIYGGSFALPTHATIYTEKDNSKNLHFSAECFVLTILGLLKGLDWDEVIEACENRDKFEVIKNRILNIKSPEELKIQFPRIYELYVEQMECNESLIELEELVNDPNVPIELKLKNVANMTNGFKDRYSNFDLKREQEFARNFSMQAYLERIVKAMENMLDNFSEIVSIYESHTLNIESFDEENNDKLNLYIASKFMDEIEIAEAEDKQRFLFYLTNYFKDNVETKVTRVKLKLNNRKVTPISLYERYKKVLASNPELLAVNFSPTDFRDMSQEEIEEFIVAYLSELSAKWELIPNDDNSIEKTIRTSVKRNYRKLTEEERKEKEARLLNLYIEKKKFYDQTDPYFRIKGKNTFDGYIGYIYSNSIVVLEKFYENSEKTKIADNNAIYIMNMRDFYELSQHSKPFLTANHLCRRVIHKKNWQDRVLKYINIDRTNSGPEKVTQQLIADNKVVIKERKL